MSPSPVPMTLDQIRPLLRDQAKLLVQSYRMLLRAGPDMQTLLEEMHARNAAALTETITRYQASGGALDEATLQFLFDSGSLETFLADPSST